MDELIFVNRKCIKDLTNSSIFVNHFTIKVPPNQTNMKKLFTLLVATLLVGYLFGQAVQRNQVVLEIGTGTWCTYCPGAANAAHDLLLNGKQVAVIENHNGDGFTNNYSNARNSYYNITGFPTGVFDGVSPYVGGAACPSGNVYTNYLSLYNSRYAVLSPLLVDISGVNNSGTYNMVISIKKLATITATDLRLHLVLTESNISTSPWPGGSGCMTSVHHVNRLMVPDENGTPISFTSGDMQIITLSFVMDSQWVPANCELVAFIQDNSGKECLNGSKVALLSLPPPIPVDFTGTPTSGCAPVTVNYTDQSTGVTNWQWNLPGGTPATSTQQNPTVVYNTLGTYDVTLTAWNSSTNRGNKKVRTGFLSINGAPPAPGTPAGPGSLCSDPGIQVYYTTGATGATSYNWDLTPTAAGTITPNGTSCSVNFNSTYVGTANLKVQGVSSCGTGSWSSSYTITLNQLPTVPGTPAGPAALCVNPSNTDYTTTGSTPATSYIWDLTPTTAGTINYTGTTATVDWSNTYTGTAQLKVSAMNGGCQGPWSTALDITISAAPTAYNVTGGGAFCSGGAGIPVGLSNSQTGTNYTLFKDGTATTTSIPGTGSAISFGNQTNAGTYTVKAAPAGALCEVLMTGNAIVTMDPQAPGTPANPAGSMYPEAGTTVPYTTSGATYATSYIWSLNPASAGTVSGTGTTANVTWSSSFTGSATITVKAVNSCGESASSSLTVDVVAVGIANLTNGNYVTIYPNPTKGMINLVAEKSFVADILVTNNIGRQMISLPKVTLSTTSKMDLSSLKAGVYFISIQGKGGNQVSKIIVE